MTVLCAQTVRSLRPVEPLVERSTINGMSYGLSAAGYDIRIDQDRLMWPGRFTLASTLERFQMPRDVIGIVHDKSTWARRGIAVQNTVIEPGYQGFLTLEITNHGIGLHWIRKGEPIAQVIFHRLDAVTEQPYRGKYQHQPRRPVKALRES